jgi:hypothetical protein
VSSCIVPPEESRVTSSQSQNLGLWMPFCVWTVIYITTAKLCSC